MTEQSDRFRRVAEAFTERVDGVPEGGWDAPAPVEGWVASEVVGHLVEWLSGLFFGAWGIEAPPAPPVDDDPAGAWGAARPRP